MTDFEKVELGPGDWGTNEYNELGADGSTACEFEDAEDSGKILSPWRSFWRDRKEGRCLSLEGGGGGPMLVVTIGWSVEVEAFADEYMELVPEVELSIKLVVDIFGNIDGKFFAGDGRVGNFLSLSLET